MAILQKRRSSKTLPPAIGPRALTSLARPTAGTQLSTSPTIGSGVRAPITSTTSSSVVSPRPSTATSSTVPATGASTTGTSTTGTSTAPKVTSAITTPTKTTATSGVKNPTVTPAKTNTNSAVSAVTNALTGTALGAGTKLAVDKLTGLFKPTPSAAPKAKATPNISAAPVSMAQKAAAAKKAGSAKAPVTSTVIPPSGGTSSGSQTLEELGRIEGDTEPFKPPADALVDLNTNTYTVYQNGVNFTFNATDGSIVSAENAPIDEEGAYPSTEPQRYYEDENGLFYERQADGSYSLISTQEDELPPEEDYLNNPYTSDAYYTDEYGNTFQKQDDGSYEFMFGNDDNTNEQTSFDQSVLNDPLYWKTVDDPEAYNYYTSDDYYSQFDDFRNGGLITMMKKGGVAKFDTGGYVDNGDGTYTIGYNVYDMETNDLLYSLDDSGNVTDVNQSYVYSPQEKVSTGASGFGQSQVRASNAPWPAGYVSNGDGTATKVYSDGSTSTIDENENIIDTTGADENAVQFSSGSGDRPWYSNLGNTLQQGLTGATKLGSSALSGISDALGTTAGAAGAGALLATLLGQYSSGDSSSQNPGIDMSKVGVIKPRTTDFGIGPSRFVGYEDYGTDAGGYAPNEELLRNLNAPGFNPVNEGDYGYETPAETTAQVPQMASGGLSSMRTPVASYYTFGQPADILANLGMRPQPPQNPPEMNAQVGQQQPAQQAQQQGLPQQSPPLASQQMSPTMPQQGMMPQQQGMPPPMRKGGLPHVSNVPLVEGRMDFRNGSAVHGDGDGQSDDIPAMLADGEYVIDAETVAQIGNGSTKAGAQALDKFRENIRSHKRSAPVNKIPPKTKALTSYLKGVK